jgi:hypothetical protein
VLAIHAPVIATVVHTGPGGKLTISEPGTLRWAFWLLLALTVALFVVGRRPSRTSTKSPNSVSSQWHNVEWQDLIRLIIPAGAFGCWTMLEPASVWNAVAPGMSSGLRLLIPLVGAAFLAAVTKGLVSHSDKELSPQQKQAKDAAQTAAPKTPPVAQAAPPVPQPTPADPGPAQPALQAPPHRAAPHRAPPHRAPPHQAAPLAAVPEGAYAEPVPAWVYWSQP